MINNNNTLGEPIAGLDDYYDLGSFSRRITTTSSEAQIWFNRGLTWAYSFNHGEARKCFHQVIRHDPACAMGYWGVAFVSGPNYNKSWKVFDRQDRRESLRLSFESMTKAEEHIQGSSPTERALIGALKHRFLADYTLDDVDVNGLLETNKTYSKAMRKVWQDFGESDLDVVAIFADALMSTAPWKLVDVRNREPIPSSPTLEIKEVLERGLQHPNAKNHPGLLHMHIHLMEMSATPEAALNSANRLRNLVPDAGHMQHMPTHIDVLLGRYQQAIESNWKATVVDDRYYADHGGNNFYSFYRMHNYHSLIYATMLAGQRRVSLEAVDRMERTLTPDMLKVKSPPMADWLESFLSIRVHVLIRFGLWEQLKAMHLPQDQDLYCVKTAMTYYGKAIAWLATQNVDEAQRHRRLFNEAVKKVPNTRLVFPNKMSDLFKIATAMLDGEIEYRIGNYDAAFERLRKATALEDSLPYSEPWGWMLPTRHPYAALLLEQGHVKQAARAYAEDLGFCDKGTKANRHVNNVWALHGYHECMIRLGREEEAKGIRGKLDEALNMADTPIQSSCYCRLKMKLV